MSTNHLNTELLDVAVLRFKLQQAKDTLADRQRRFDEENANLIDEIKAIGGELAIAEGDVKLRAVDHFRDTGEKKPCDGLEVKVFKTLDYDADAAFGWAAAHPEKGLLTLDKKLYEKLLKLARENNLPDWADAPGTLSDEPRAQLSADLTKVFPIVEIVAAGIPLEKPEPES